MKGALQDTWHDLRERRLWPIALALLIAIVAIPALLTKSVAAPSQDAPPPLATVPQTGPATVQLDDGPPGASGVGSALDRFAENDPFTPPAAIAKGGQGTDSATAASASSPGGPADGPTGDGVTRGGDPAPVVPQPAPPIGPPVTRTETAEFEYVADLTFWVGDRRRARRGLRKLDMLPNEAAPVLIFMGTSDKGGNAVFLVDATLTPAGEGRCVPNPQNCVYVHVGPGSEHAFTTEAGDSYRVRVDEIRRVRVRAEASARENARAAVGSDDGAGSQRRFQLPALIDLVEVTTTTTTGSPEPSNAGRAGSSRGPDGR